MALLRSSRWALPAAASVMLMLASPATAAAQQDFSVLRTSPDAEIRFEGLALKDARTDAADNEIILSFTGQADPDLFARLQSALPDWVDMAYSGGASAVIRATRPVTFMTRGVRDGFALRLVGRRRPASERAYLRGQIGGNSGTVELAGMQHDDPRDAFALRGSDLGAKLHGHAVTVMLAQKPLALTQGSEHETAKAERGGFVSVSGHWRHPEHGRIVEAEFAAAVPLADGVKLTGAVHDVDASGKAVRRLDGTDAKLNENAISASAGLAFTFDGITGLGEARGEALWGKTGWGGRLAYAETMHEGSWGLSGEYHAPFDDTLEAVANHGYRDQVELDFAQRLARELWAEADLHATRYGVEGDKDVAETAGASASLRYLVDLDGIWGGLSYEFNGDYVIKSHKYLGAASEPFTPLDIRTFEVHALSASLSRELFRDFWIDAYGGYAIDRYGPDGYFGGGELRYAMAPGWALTLGGGYSQISTEQGERGPITSAGLKLVYNWDDAEEDAASRPLDHPYFGNL